MTAPSSTPFTTVAEVGEEQIIRCFQDAVLPQGTTGIGDDCAVTEGPDGYKRLTTTDLFLEQIHFELDYFSAEDVGYKALAVNLSDVAAMGGTPDGIFLSLALQLELDVRWVNGFRDGLMQLAQKFKVPLLGGDTTRSAGDIMISLTVTGLVKPHQLKLRSAAQPGDVLCVTGSLGDSAAGLALLQETKNYQNISLGHRNELIAWHRRPQPAVDQGKWLAQKSAVNAMIDLSDGVLVDARHLAEQSSCSIQINLDQLPLSAAFKAFCEMAGGSEKGQELAAAGGEDYRLLFTLPEEQFQNIARQFEQQFGSPIYSIGTVREGSPSVQTFRNGEATEVREKEFQHFKTS